MSTENLAEETVMNWTRVCSVSDVPTEGGIAVRLGEDQVALFRFASRGEWYAMDNFCPHKKSPVLGRGMLGDAGGVPKVTCPLHKRAFCLHDGKEIGGDHEARTWPVKVEGEDVFLGAEG